MNIKSGKTQLLLLLILGLFSCKDTYKRKSDDFDWSSFKGNKQLNGKSYHLSNLKTPVRLAVIKKSNLLLVVDADSKFYVKAYSLDSLKFLKEFVPKGAAINHQISCMYIQYDPVSDEVYCGDLAKKKLFAYKVADILSPGNPVYPTDEIALQSNYFFTPLLLRDRKIIDFHYNKSGAIRLFDIYTNKGDFLRSAGTFPALLKEKPALEINGAFSRGASLSKDGKNLVVAYWITDYLDKYDSNGKLLKRVHGPDFFEPEVETSAMLGGSFTHYTKDTRKAFVGTPQMANGHLYVLYDGKPVTKDYHTNKMLVFDNDLKPQEFLSLNVDVFAIDLDEESNTIFALTHKASGKNLVKYQLK